MRSQAVLQKPRREILEEFRDRARAVNAADDSDFVAILREAQEHLDLSDADLAIALLVSRPTVNRWINHKSLPHRAMRRPIIGWIENQVAIRLKSHERRGTSYHGGAVQWPSEAGIAAKSR